MTEQESLETQQTSEKPAPPAEPSRFGRFMRRALRWITAVAAIFALGVAAAWFVRVSPQQAEIAQLRADLEVAEAQVETLEGRVAELEGVEAELLLATRQKAILSVLSNVHAARLALAEGDSSGAASALALAEEGLDEVEEVMGTAFAAQVADLRARFELAQQEVEENDRFAAQRDLEVVVNLLLELESALQES